MLKHDNMQKVAMGVLAAMLVVSLVLAVATFVMPAPVAADGRPVPEGCPPECNPIYLCTYCCVNGFCCAYDLYWVDCIDQYCNPWGYYLCI